MHKMEIEIKNQELKTAQYSLQITNVEFWHDHCGENGNNAPIKCNFKSTFEMKIGHIKIIKEVSNTVLVNPEELIYKEILLHSKHIILV